jgi:type IV pilus assembly protein PilY1
LLHAFWANETKRENNEEWALIPPAVMPNLKTSYPSSHQFLLDGTPVVKDVVWQRNSGLLATGDNPWHTMLVAGFGPYQRGYYAIDVTNPDASGLVSGNTTLKPAGPDFRWQLTTVPATNYPIFAAQSAIPAITTLLMDPGDGVVREIGVAVLPGGVDAGGPSSSLSGGPSCARAVKTVDSAPISGFTARDAVRCWNPNQKSTDVVNGRAVTIVRLDTGEILRVFARKTDFQAYPNDTIATANRVTNTLLDSPMTGMPVVYPGDVGTAATKIFVGDADGTIWRFDVSSSDPTKWTGQLYLDTYNKQADTSVTSWADGQPFEVPMVASLDTGGELVLNVATGSIETFDTNGTNYVYSVTEKMLGNPLAPHAFVNWYLGSNSASASLRPGERVSGPMTVFNGTLYFSTYAASTSTTVACSNGNARLYGWDFVQPLDTGCSMTDPTVTCNRNYGGVRELQYPAGTTPDYVDASGQGLAPAGAVIPGVSIQATPACASISQSSQDPYVAGGTHRSLSGVTPQTYSLFAQVGAKSAAGVTQATQQVQLSLPTPSSPTVIDSWAAVLE